MGQKAFFFALAGLLMFSQSAFAHTYDAANISSVPRPMSKPALFLKLSAYQTEATKNENLHSYRVLGPWPNANNRSYQLLGGDWQSIDFDVSVALKPKRVMSLEANW